MHFCEMTLEYSSIIFTSEYPRRRFILYHDVPIQRVRLCKTALDVNTWAWGGSVVSFGEFCVAFCSAA